MSMKKKHTVREEWVIMAEEGEIEGEGEEEDVGGAGRNIGIKRSKKRGQT